MWRYILRVDNLIFRGGDIGVDRKCGTFGMGREMGGASYWSGPESGGQASREYKKVGEKVIWLQSMLINWWTDIFAFMLKIQPFITFGKFCQKSREMTSFAHVDAARLWREHNKKSILMQTVKYNYQRTNICQAFWYVLWSFGKKNITISIENIFLW